MVSERHQVNSICKVLNNTGRAWIEDGGKIHFFVVGDKSHPKSSEIYAMLTQLQSLLKQHGHVPDTNWVLQDIAEQDKEANLCSHR